MYYDDFIAQQVMKTKDPWSSRPLGAREPTRYPLHTLWAGVRRLVYGVGSSLDRAAQVRRTVGPPRSGRRRS